MLNVLSALQLLFGKVARGRPVRAEGACACASAFAFAAHPLFHPHPQRVDDGRVVHDDGGECATDGPIDGIMLKDMRKLNRVKCFLDVKPGGGG